MGEQGAVESYTSALKEDPSQMPIACNRAQAYLKLGDFTAAKVCCRFSPPSLTVHFLIGAATGCYVGRLFAVPVSDILQIFGPAAFVDSQRCLCSPSPVFHHLFRPVMFTRSYIHNVLEHRTLKIEDLLSPRICL